MRSRVWNPIQGSSFSEELGHVLDLANVSTVEVLRFVRPHAFLGREVSEEAREMARSAREEYRQRGYGFWEAVISRLVAATRPTQDGVLRHALAHAEAPVDREQMSLGNFLDRLENNAYNELPDREIAALSSRVVTRSRRAAHLALIDFAVESNANNDGFVVALATALDLHGVIFNSGRSYHFYGAQLLTDSDLPKFLARAQLVSPLVDHRWACHQVIDGECSLRISTDRKRHTASHHPMASSLNRATTSSNQ